MAGDTVGIEHRPNPIAAGSSSLAWGRTLRLRRLLRRDQSRLKAITIERFIGLWRMLGPGGVEV